MEETESRVKTLCNCPTSRPSAQESCHLPEETWEFLGGLYSGRNPLKEQSILNGFEVALSPPEAEYLGLWLEGVVAIFLL